MSIARHILSQDASKLPFLKRTQPAQPANVQQRPANAGLRARFANAISRLTQSQRLSIWLAWFGLVGVVSGLALFDGNSGLSRVLIAAGAVLLLAAVHISQMIRRESVAEPQNLAKLDAVSRRIDKRIERLEDVRWQLRDNNQRLRDLLDAQEDVIMRRDAGGRLTFVNRAFCTRFAIKPEDVLGTDFSPSELDVADSDEDADADNGNCASESLHRPEGDVRYIETATGPSWFCWREKLIPTQDGLSYDKLLIGRDVTAQHRYEIELAEARDQAEAASRAKSRFLASMSHEIRTPMNGILGLSGLLLESERSANQRTFVAAVDQSARTLLALIDEILDFSRIEANRLDLNPVPFSIADSIQSVIELLAPRAHDKDLEIAWSIAPDVPRTLLGDDVRIRQILMNLVGNAIKFTERGGVAVKLEAQPVHQHNCRLKLTVTDTGIGIAPDAIVSIFGEFERADASNDRNYAGTGLGLAIALRLARAMGGDIKVASAPGRGATFTVELDLAVAPHDSSAWIEPGPGIANVTVVLAFDHLLERRSMAAMLRDHGAFVIEADDPHSVAQCAELRRDQRRVDMFVVSATEEPAAAANALDSLRRQTQASAIRGFVLASPAERTQLAEFRAFGFEHHLVRPVRPKSLLTQLCEQSQTAIGKKPPITARAAAGMASSCVDSADTVRVLLAEDNDINALLTETMLGNCGCEATRARNGREAVAMVLAALEDGDPFDVVLMDLHMPEIDGIAATRQIREACAERGFACPAVVAVTANAFAEDRDRCLAAGMDDYLAKPFDRDELVEVINRIGLAAGSAPGTVKMRL